MLRRELPSLQDLFRLRIHARRGGLRSVFRPARDVQCVEYSGFRSLVLDRTFHDGELRPVAAHYVFRCDAAALARYGLDGGRACHWRPGILVRRGIMKM